MKNLLIILAIIFSSVTHAEIEKNVTMCPDNKKICYYWWPKLTHISGWHQDEQYSYHFRVNAQAPDGYTFINANVAIYAKAIYKPSQSESKTLNEFIAADLKSLQNDDSPTETNKVDLLTTSDGQSLVSYTFTPKNKGNW